MNVAVAKTDRVEAADETPFALARSRLPGSGAVTDLRREAYDAFQRIGLPHRRIEDWKYTDLRALMREVLPLAAAPDAEALARAAAALKLHAIDGVRRLVLVDGVLAPSLSEFGDLEPKLSLRSLRDILAGGDAVLQEELFGLDSNNPMIALNSAMMTDGVVIAVADGAKLTQPLHVVHIASGGAPAAMFTRSMLKLGNDSSATLVESYIAGEGAAAYQVHDALVIAIGDRARLDHIRLVEDGREAFNITSSAIDVGAHAHFNTFGMATGAFVSRYQAVINVAGEHSRVAGELRRTHARRRRPSG